MSETSAAPEPLNSPDERLWATLIHIGGIVLLFVPAFVGYLMLRDRGAFIRDNVIAALNFQITVAIVLFIGTLSIIAFVGLIIVPAVFVINTVLSILAALAANRGEHYVYPLSFHFVK